MISDSHTFCKKPSAENNGRCDVDRINKINLKNPEKVDKY